MDEEKFEQEIKREPEIEEYATAEEQTAKADEQDAESERTYSEEMNTEQPEYRNYYAEQQQQQKPEQKSDSNGFGIASMVLGIVSLVFFCTCINFVTAILAIIFGIIQLVRKSSKKGMAIAGLITGGLSLLFAVVFWVSIFVNGAVFSSLANDWNQEIYQFEQQYENPLFDNDDSSVFDNGDDTF